MVIARLGKGISKTEMDYIYRWWQLINRRGICVPLFYRAYIFYSELTTRPLPNLKKTEALTNVYKTHFDKKERMGRITF